MPVPVSVSGECEELCMSSTYYILDDLIEYPPYVCCVKGVKERNASVVVYENEVMQEREREIERALAHLKMSGLFLSICKPMHVFMCMYASKIETERIPGCS